VSEKKTVFAQSEKAECIRIALAAGLNQREAEIACQTCSDTKPLVAVPAVSVQELIDRSNEAIENKRLFDIYKSRRDMENEWKRKRDERSR
jgi:hypothetical protein